MARIDGNGATDTVLLHNVEHYTLRNLEITNFTTGEADDYGPQAPVGTNNAGSYPVTRGINVVVEDTGVSSGFKLTDLYVTT